MIFINILSLSSESLQEIMFINKFSSLYKYYNLKELNIIFVKLELKNSIYYLKVRDLVRDIKIALYPDVYIKVIIIKTL